MGGGHEEAEALWLAAVAGDGEAFASLFDLHRDRVYRHALHLLDRRDDAEDATAAAFLELWRRRSTVRLIDGSVLPWLLVTTTNVSRNTRRASHRYRQLLQRLPREDVAPDLAIHAIANADNATGGSDLARRLRTLRPIDSVLLSLVVFEGYPIAEAAQAVGISPAAAKTRLHRSRNRLRLLWGETASEGATS